MLYSEGNAEKQHNRKLCMTCHFIQDGRNLVEQ